MKSKFIAALLIVSLVLPSCLEEFLAEKPSEKKKKIEMTSLLNESHLMPVLDQIGFSNQTGGRMKSGGLEILTDSILKVLQPDSTSYAYTFRIEKDLPAHVFENLVLKKTSGGYLGFILRYESAQEGVHLDDLKNFTGKVSRYDLEDNLLSGVYFENGERIQDTQGKAAMLCLADVNVYEECVSGGGISQTTGLPMDWDCTEWVVVIEFIYEPCPPGDSGGGGGTGFPDPGLGGGGGGGSSGGGGNPGSGDSPGDGTGDAEPGFEGEDPEPIGVLPPKIQFKVDQWEETKIDDSQLRPCMQTIVTDLKNLTQGSVGQIIQKFSGNIPGYNWEVKDGVLPGSENANTLIQYNTATGTVTTVFDANKFTNSTDLSIARTILHESIHAYVVAVTYNTLTDTVQKAQLLGPDWATAFLNYGHDYITNNYLTPIADALEQYGQNKGYNLSRQFYEDLAWGGLTHYQTPPHNETALFLQNVPNSTDRNRILNTISTEQTGNDFYGNPSTQSGNNAGC